MKRSQSSLKLILRRLSSSALASRISLFWQNHPKQLDPIEALAAQLQQLVALGVAQLYCCAEAFGYAAHQAAGALVVAGDAVEGEPCPPGAADAAGPILRGGWGVRWGKGAVTGGGTC
jgi:hypothetical protein